MRKRPRSQKQMEDQRKRAREDGLGRRVYMKEKKLEAGFCSECGIACTEDNWVGFDWDHIDPSTKLFMLSRTSNRSWIQIENELKKCRLLCKICHAVIGYRENHFRLGHKKYDEIDPQINNQLELDL